MHMESTNKAWQYRAPVLNPMPARKISPKKEDWRGNTSVTNENIPRGPSHRECVRVSAP